ncbi:hypothetical protein [Nocardioides ungokensis]|uniref:hypothetical protein n=1 Tax=Nocardioides ungokensis TaxID=1643322 RepID=UPI0015DD5E91|nr:hypothetical protein [Nocardioides ungokensis]
MPTDSGRPDFDPTDAIMDVTMDVSRAHLLLTGTLEWVPRPVRRHTDEALVILDDAITALREIAVVLHAQALDARDRDAQDRDAQALDPQTTCDPQDA